MLGWLDSILNFFTGGLKDIWNKLIGVVRTLAGWTQNNISALQARYNQLFLGEWNLSTWIANFVNRTYNPRQIWIDAQLRNLANQERNDANGLRNDILGLKAYVTGQFDAESLFIAGKIAGLIKWVLTSVFGPLLSDVTHALAWIAKEGAYVLDLLTHRDKLAELLIGWLWIGWIGLFTKFFKPLVIYVLQRWKSLIPVIIPIIEDIIDHVL